ncbi:hypothetical protein BFJ65_g14826 [Fusarium oxysporum f. sp. cepae]|uniref:Uncharacterized protein n=1 Tax=Fusarium oxysporum f. sp. cepae TaxID=396571 RepID=A0A3L6N0F6_FUSOX|nr:hypothetical protein BFJ65_g14826 [Fusarium oxysporum f. sp. cepae]
MSTQAVHGGPIPGLQRTLTTHDLEKARQQYDFPSFIRNAVADVCSHNNLPEDDILLKVVEKIRKHLPQLRLLFQKFGVVNLFGVHVPHRHFTVPDRFHLVGQTEARDESLYLTRLMDDTFNPSEVCGRKFVYDPQRGWCPHEFHYGPMPDIRNVDPEFFLRFTEYLVTNELTSILGLMYLPQELLLYDMIEFVLSNCALLLVQAASTRITDDRVTTSWNFSDPIYTRETDCIPDRFGKHPPRPDDFLLQPRPVINDAIQQHYPRIL